jgi:hypothetical protein
VERVERVEELFLRLRLSGEELDVVDEEQVAPLAVARAELVHLLVLQRLHELVHEALGADVDDARFRPLLAHAMGDGVDEVRLAEPRAAADEERVVPPPAAARRRHRRRVRELVRRADDEVGERVLRVEPLDRAGATDARDPGDGVHGSPSWGGLSRRRMPTLAILRGSRSRPHGRARAHRAKRASGRSATGCSSAPSMIQRTWMLSPVSARGATRSPSAGNSPPPTGERTRRAREGLSTPSVRPSN